jgi:hypothetical protein
MITTKNSADTDGHRHPSNANDRSLSDNGDERNNQDPTRNEEEVEPLSNDGEHRSDHEDKTNSSNGPQDTESDGESVRFTRSGWTPKY